MNNTDYNKILNIITKKFRIYIGELQKHFKETKDTIRSDEGQKNRMEVGNVDTEYCTGWADGYSAAMNDVLRRLSEDMELAPTIAKQYTSCRLEREFWKAIIKRAKEAKKNE